MIKAALAILVSLGMVFQGLSIEPPTKVKADTAQVGAKMSEIKQTLLGLEKEVAPGQLIKIKVSPMQVTSENTVTAIYKFALLENGKLSNNCETLTTSEKNTDPPKTGSDFIMTTLCDNTIKYQVIFSVTYIETKTGTKEVISVTNSPVAIYDVKVSGYKPPTPNPTPNPDNIPDSNFGLIRIVYLECIKMELDKDKKAILFDALANTFSAMQSKIAAGVYKDSTNEDEQIDRVETFLKETKTSVNDAIKKTGIDPKIFDGKVDVAIQGVLSKAYDAGKMKKFADYQSAWAEIAEGFRLSLKSQQ